MPNANLVAARNQLRTLVSIYNSNFDQYQQATYLSLLISQIYLYMIVQYAQLKAMKLAPHLLHTIITQSMKISLRRFTRCSRKNRS